jgi:hypothetical protein
MNITDEIRSKINQIDELATEVAEFLYEIQDNDEENLSEDQIDNRAELQSALSDLNDTITTLQESEGWI